MRPISLLVFALFLFVSCTSNPFFGDDTARDTHVVRGKVLLDSAGSSADIYVWLEQLNISTRTDARGDFKLELPRTDELTGYNNDLKLYYYVGNYAVQFSRVLLVDGVFQFDKYDINNEGFIRETVYLSQILKISTDLEFNDMPRDYNDSLQIQITVTPRDTNLLVINRTARDGNLSGFIFREMNSPATAALRFDLNNSVNSGYRLSEPVTWTSVFIWPQNLLPAGKFEVYPFIFWHQEGVPRELIDSFGINADQFTNAYLTVPFKHDSDTLTVF